MLSISFKTPKDIEEELKTKFKQKRKFFKISQKELSLKSGVSLGSLKRFEQSGKISFSSLLQLAVILGCLEEFENICNKKEEEFKSIEEILK